MRASNAKIRNPAVELFRCLLMFLIVLGYSWGEGIFFPGRGVCERMDWWAFLVIGMLIWHVDLLRRGMCRCGGSGPMRC